MIEGKTRGFGDNAFKQRHPHCLSCRLASGVPTVENGDPPPLQLQFQATLQQYHNRVTSFTNAAGYVLQYRYDGNGNLTNLIYPGNLTVKYYYDSNNRLTNVTDWSSRQTVLMYDLAGHLTTITRPNNTLRSLSYDDDGELTNIVEQTTTKFPICFYTLHYNMAGRSDWEFKGPLPHTNIPPTRTMTYDADNRLATFNGTSVSVDNDGNLTSGPLTNNTFGTYTYDARNELTSAGGISYGYDPAGNRTSLTNGSTNTTFVVDPKTSQTLMRIKNGVTNYYIYGKGLLYEIDVTDQTNPNTTYYHYDSRGSTVALTDANGNPTDFVEYSPYGTTTYRFGTNDTPFLYNGRFGVQTDPNGLLYMRARYYNPYISRFLNPDPSGFVGGLNFYQFANGNPISLIDPFGLGAAGEGGFFSWLNGALNTIGNALGYVWNAPNSAIGLVIGLAGLPFGGDLPTFGHNGIQFANNPLLFSQGAITFGNVMNFGAPTTDPTTGQPVNMGPDDPLFENSPWTYGDHEMQHTIQGMELGPLFLPTYGAGMIGALLQGQSPFGAANFLETGPYFPDTHNQPPQVWP